MAYSQYTLASLTTQLGILLDDQSSLYWSVLEKHYAIWEALRTWGAYTSYWRDRGTLSYSPGTPPTPTTSPYIDLALALPNLRSRTWTLDQLTQEIQFACLEAASGIAGTGMSGQISITSILQSIQRARNRFVIDAHIPFTLDTALAPVSPPNGLVEFPNTSVYVHNAVWKDGFTGTYTNLWREDAWAIDRNDPTWTLSPGQPRAFSESELSPLKLQIAPPPVGSGELSALTVDSLMLDLTDSAATFNLPDEWIHAVKYAALSDIFSSESQNSDPVRAQYAETRYQQAIDLAQSARSVARLLVNGVPLPLDSLAALDAAVPYWRNQTGPPQIAGALYDMIGIYPAIPDQTYGLAIDVVRSAPLPVADSDPIQVGPEDINAIINYATHIMTFKCGGTEFKNSFSSYDAFLDQVRTRGRINKVKLRYMQAILAQPQKEEAERPDMVGGKRG